MVCTLSRVVWKYILHLDSCDINKKNERSDSKDSRAWFKCRENKQVGFKKSVLKPNLICKATKIMKNIITYFLSQAQGLIH